MKYILLFIILFPPITFADTNILISRSPNFKVIYNKTFKEINNKKKDTYTIDTGIKDFKCEYIFRNLDYNKKNDILFDFECYEYIKIDNSLSYKEKKKIFNVNDGFVIVNKYKSSFRHLFNCKKNNQNNGCKNKTEFSYDIDNKGYTLTVSVKSE